MTGTVVVAALNAILNFRLSLENLHNSFAKGEAAKTTTINLPPATKPAAKIMANFPKVDSHGCGGTAHASPFSALGRSEGLFFVATRKIVADYAPTQTNGITTDYVRSSGQSGLKMHDQDPQLAWPSAKLPF